MFTDQHKQKRAPILRVRYASSPLDRASSRDGRDSSATSLLVTSRAFQAASIHGWHASHDRNVRKSKGRKQKAGSTQVLASQRDATAASFLPRFGQPAAPVLARAACLPSAMAPEFWAVCTCRRACGHFSCSALRLSICSWRDTGTCP
jgi:hypothetical protein